jgi:hypothetical protein
MKATSKRSVGGLVAAIKPNRELRLRDSHYVVRNVGHYSIRVQIYTSENSKIEKKPKN